MYKLWILATQQEKCSHEITCNFECLRLWMPRRTHRNSYCTKSLHEKIAELEAKNTRFHETLDRLFDVENFTTSPPLSNDVDGIAERLNNDAVQVTDTSKDEFREKLANDVLQVHALQKSVHRKDEKQHGQVAIVRPHTAGKISSAAQARKQTDLKSSHEDELDRDPTQQKNSSIVFRPFRPLSAGSNHKKKPPISNHIPVSHELHRSRIAWNDNSRMNNENP